MPEIKAGDLVRDQDGSIEMLAIGRADDETWHADSVVAFFCVWEQNNLLHEEIFPLARLVIVRKERRRIPRGGQLEFPKYTK